MSGRSGLASLFLIFLVACDPADPSPGAPGAEYSVGGTVSGLKGTGLVLANNESDTLAISGAGSFVFAQPIADAGAYAVQVVAQPADPQQTCSVSNGDGMINGADVTNVSVNCVSGSYSVGGSLSGLSAGMQVKLRINGGDDLTLTADGAFTFATPLEDGAAYSVSVHTQPLGETCTVNNAAGTLAGADVTNVAVHCVVNLYSVGGSVSGLAGSGLTLKLNDAESLSISADGIFTFTAAFTTGSAYAVTVATQPANPRQTCTLANPGGLVNGAAVTNINVTCATNTYTVGGTVGGLTGTGLVLKINGGETESISADGGYTFDTALADLSAYSVTVATQPTSPDQICSVANATGNLAGAAVDDVDLSCALAYSIGGTVSGLGASTGLVLRINGGEMVTVNADGGFTFATLVGDGYAYSVTVATQPSPALDCAVTGGAGVVSAAAVNSITVDCTGWRTAGLIESETLDANVPQVAYLPNGDALTVWYQQDASTKRRLLTSRYYAGDGTWSTPVRIDTVDYTVNGLDLAVDPNGNALVVWTQANATSNYDLWGRIFYASGATWGTAGLLESGSYDASFPQAAFDVNGNGMVVWMQRVASNRSDIWAKRYAAGSGWEVEGLIETGDPGNAVYPNVAFDGSGNAVVAWHQSDGTRLNVWSNRYVSGSGWGTAALIETDNTGAAEYPVVAADASGNAIVAWEQYNGSGFNIVSNRFNGVAWGTPVTVETATESARWPAIAMDAAGNAMVIWRQIGIGNAASVWANRYDQAGAAWETAVRIGTGGYDTGVMNREIVFDAAGNATAIWSQNVGFPTNTDELYANRYQGGAWIGAKNVELGGGNATVPALAVDSLGNTMAVWAQPAGGFNSIWYNVYR